MTQHIREILTTGRYPALTERHYHQLVSDRLTRNGIEHVNEYLLDNESRIDIWVPAHQTGIELKTQGTLPKITAQLAKYAQHPQVKHLILATPVRRIAQATPTNIPHATFHTVLAKR